MFNKFKYVFLLLFSLISVVNCESKYTVIFDFEVDSNKNIRCAVKPDDHVVLVKGEKMEMLANNVMSQVIYMWCKDQDRNTQVDRCSYDVEAKQCTAVVDDPKPSRGIWDCEYLLKRDDTSISSTRFKHGTEYNYARCTLLVEIKGTLWFTGLDPKRRSIKTTYYQTIYEYKFKMGEKLNISCEQEGGEAKNFKFSDALTYETDLYIGSRFERQATLNLSSKMLSCSIAGKTGLNQTNIVLYLKQDSCRDPLWFTGLDYSRVTTTTIVGKTDYIYKYKLNENLKIGCETNTNDTELIFNFIAAVNSTGINLIRSPSLFEFSSANSTLNSSSLLCFLRTYFTETLYTVNLYFDLDLSDTIDAQEHKTEPPTDEGPKFNWKVILIAVTVVSLCAIVLCIVLVCKRKKILVVEKLTPKYFTLKEQRTQVPPENTYSGMKENSNFGEPLYCYADLNRRRLNFGPDETYAEPTYTKTELSPPSPPQKGSNTPTELKYTNVFKQGYVNSQK